MRNLQVIILLAKVILLVIQRYSHTKIMMNKKLIKLNGLCSVPAVFVCLF